MDDEAISTSLIYIGVRLLLRQRRIAMTLLKVFQQTFRFASFRKAKALPYLLPEPKLKNIKLILELKKLDEVDERRWDELLFSSTYSTVYHSLSWCKVWQKTYPQSDYLFLILTDEKGNYWAGFPLWEKNKYGLKSLYSLPFGTYGGPIFKGEVNMLFRQKGLKGGTEQCSVPTSIQKELINKFTEVSQKWNVLQIQTVDFFNQYDFLSLFGFSYKDYFAHLLDLTTIDDNSPMEGFDKKRKEGIRQSQRRGVLIKDMESLEEVKRCYELTLDTYCRYGIEKPKYPLLLFENIFRVMRDKNLLKWVVVLKDNQIIGSLMNFAFKDMVYAWEGASDYDSQNFRPNDSLFFHTILWAKKNNFKLFNFGATPSKALGMQRFKESWGTFVKPYKIYEKKSWLGKVLSKLRKGDGKV